MPPVSLRVTERCLLVKAVGEGLLARSWAVQAAIKQDKYPSLSKKEWSGIRKRLETAFPDLPDITKVRVNLKASICRLRRPRRGQLVGQHRGQGWCTGRGGYADGMRLPWTPQTLGREHGPTSCLAASSRLGT